MHLKWTYKTIRHNVDTINVGWKKKGGRWTYLAQIKSWQADMYTQ